MYDVHITNFCIRTTSFFNLLHLLLLLQIIIINHLNTSDIDFNRNYLFKIYRQAIILHTTLHRIIGNPHRICAILTKGSFQSPQVQPYLNGTVLKNVDNLETTKTNNFFYITEIINPHINGNNKLDFLHQTIVIPYSLGWLVIQLKRYTPTPMSSHLN